ncbi:3-hexulose-6-phosphate synthase [Paenibacillus sp. HN-1]|uniref:3-hexulose-6-phosphate synthase n=1 Tax=Paenibacillus TaxID=44249 RepID=UPI001CA99482|nr:MULTISPECIES: 3-hexulose-6-phosphate synthase [Paenibacillus]MBY9077852.1 3-hexulose-6-phosphate synthase [Paenibacillus sp. CGMCC 1.18879]MBY9088192.1 3-hexulose-6-phosphate synthase [Paenibacillus sinensis]
MKLQLALDLVDIPGAKEVVAEVADHIDIVEIGTPIVINEGLHAVKAIKDAFPSLTVLADLKVMDAGGYEVMKAAEAGADIITVLGVSDDSTIKGAVDEANKTGREVLVDLINVKDIKLRAAEVDALGVHYICVHSGYDHQADGKNSFQDLQAIKSVVKHAKTAIAGGIKLETLPEVIAAQPDLVIVGGGITSQTDKRAAAAEMKRLVNQA